MATVNNLNAVDIVVIVAYFIGVLLVGIWASFRSNRSTLEGYFLAGKGILWWPVGASLFASNIGSEHFIGLAGSGAAGGIAVGAFELNAMVVLLLLGWYFLPVYMSSGVFTMPEYLRKRYGGQRVRVYLAVLALLLSVLTKISVNMFAGALFIQQALGWNLYLAIVLLLVITGVYTVAGGLSAVIWTDAAQTFIMLAGAIVLMFLSFGEVSWNELRLSYPLAIPNSTYHSNTSCGIPREDAFHIFRHPTQADLPWPGMVFGITVSAVWYWCTDQVIVQRALASKSLAHAKGGCVLAAFLKIFPLFLIVYPGMISRVLFTEEIACATEDECMEYCSSPVGCSNVAYPKLVVEVMPTGLKGLMLAVVMSGLMSSLTSIFNSSSTIFTIDIWRRIRPRSTETELMVVGRLFVLFMIIVSILWIPIIQASQGGRLFDYIQSITSYLSPPICAVFVLAVSWGRTNEKGAFWGLMFGLVIGMTRMILDFSYPAPACGEEDDRPGIIKNWHYLYFGIFLFGVVLIFTIIVSLLTDPIDEKYLASLTFKTRNVKRQEGYDLDNDLGDIEVENANKAEDGEEVTFGRRVVDWFCGTGHVIDDVSPEEKKKALEERTDISETKVERMILNIAAIITLAVNVFLWAFFG